MSNNVAQLRIVYTGVDNVTAVARNVDRSLKETRELAKQADMAVAALSNDYKRMAQSATALAREGVALAESLVKVNKSLAAREPTFYAEKLRGVAASYKEATQAAQTFLAVQSEVNAMLAQARGINLGAVRGVASGGTSGSAGNSGESYALKQARDLTKLRDASREATVQFEIENGALKEASAAMQARNVELAKSIDLEKSLAVSRREVAAMAAAADKEAMASQKLASRVKADAWAVEQGALQDRIDENERVVAEARARAEKMPAALGKVGSALSWGVTVPIMAVGYESLKASIDYEKAFARIRKATEGSKEDFAKLDAQVKQMGSEIPHSLTEINQTVATALQFGLPKSAAADFAKVILQLGDTAKGFDIDAGGRQLAQFAGNMRVAHQDATRLGSALLALGNYGRSTEGQLVEFAGRISGTARIVGLTTAETLAMANAFTSAGVTAERGATGFNTVVTKMAGAVEKGGKELDLFAAVSGRTSKQFAEEFRSKPAQAINEFIHGLSSLRDSHGPVLEAMDRLAGKGQRFKETWLRASNEADLLTRSLEIGNDAWSKNTELARQAETQYSTTAAQLKILKNDAEKALIELGPTFTQTLKGVMPFLKEFLGGVRDLASEFNKQPEGVRKFAAELLLLTAAAGPVMSGLGKMLGLLKSIRALAGGAAAAGAGEAAAGSAAMSSVGMWAGAAAIAAPISYAINRAGVEWGDKVRFPGQNRSPESFKDETWERLHPVPGAKSSPLTSKVGVGSDFSMRGGAGLNEEVRAGLDEFGHKAKAAGSAKPKIPLPKNFDQYQGFIEAASKKYGVDPVLLTAIMMQESGGNPRSTMHNRNGTVDYGLMQTNSAIVKEFGLDRSRIYDPEYNIMAGARELRKHLDEFPDDAVKGITAYNTGRGNVNSAVGRRYAQSVLNYYKAYKGRGLFVKDSFTGLTTEGNRERTDQEKEQDAYRQGLADAARELRLFGDRSQASISRDDYLYGRYAGETGQSKGIALAEAKVSAATLKEAAGLLGTDVNDIKARTLALWMSVDALQAATDKQKKYNEVMHQAQNSLEAMRYERMTKDLSSDKDVAAVNLFRHLGITSYAQLDAEQKKVADQGAQEIRLKREAEAFKHQAELAGHLLAAKGEAALRARAKFEEVMAKYDMADSERKYGKAGEENRDAFRKRLMLGEGKGWSPAELDKAVDREFAGRAADERTRFLKNYSQAIKEQMQTLREYGVVTHEVRVAMLEFEGGARKMSHAQAESAARLMEQVQRIREQREMLKKVADDMSRVFMDAIGGTRKGLKGIVDALNESLRQMVLSIIQSRIAKWLEGAFGVNKKAPASGGGTMFGVLSSVLSSLPGKAEGGFAPAGWTGWVGEKGPELAYFPRSGGAHILSNSDSMRAAGSSGDTHHYNINVSVAPSGNPHYDRAHGDEVARKIGQSIRRAQMVAG